MSGQNLKYRKLRQKIQKIIKENICPFPKAIFMAGGPGSGKSTVLKSIGLLGKIEVINPDDAYEKSLLSAGLPLDRSKTTERYKKIKKEYLEAVEIGDFETLEALEPEYLALKAILSQNMKLFNAARKAAKQRQNELSCQDQNFIIDGTSGHYKAIVNQVEKLKSLGYDVGMIYIDVPLETSISRNRDRGKKGGRGLLDSEVEKSWTAVSKNLEPYMQYFGENLFYVDARESAFDESIDKIKPEVLNFFFGK